MGIESLSMDVVIYLLGVAAMWGNLRARLNALEKRVDAHNHFGDRVTKLETETAVEAEQIKVANHRITDLEEHRVEVNK